MAIGARKQPLYDQLVDILSEKIDHEYRPGDLMPSERELPERYGLSRTTVRLGSSRARAPWPGDSPAWARQCPSPTALRRPTTSCSPYIASREQMCESRVPETTILEFCEFEADKTSPSIWAPARREAFQTQASSLGRRHAHDDRALFIFRLGSFFPLKRPMLGEEALSTMLSSRFSQKIRGQRGKFSQASPVLRTLVCWISPRARRCWILFAPRITSATIVNTRFRCSSGSVQIQGLHHRND